MKRGNTALKRVVSVASVAAMAIAGAVLAAPAASAAPTWTAGTPGSSDIVRVIPVADSAWTTNTGSVAATATTGNYGAAHATNAPTLVSANSSFQSVRGLQIALPGGVAGAASFSGKTVTVTLAGGDATFSGVPSKISLSKTSVATSQFDTTAGVISTRGSNFDATAGVLDVNTIPPANKTINTTGNSKVLSIVLPAINITGAGAAATDSYVLTVDGIALNVPKTYSAATTPVVTATVQLDATVSGTTTLADVNPYAISADGDAVATSGTITLPKVTVSEAVQDAFATARPVTLTVTGTEASTGSFTVDYTGAKVTSNNATLTATQASAVTSFTADSPTRVESFTVSGIKVTGAKAGTDITVSVVAPATFNSANFKGDGTTPSATSFVANPGTLASTKVSQTTALPRLAGVNRYDTAAQIADKLGASDAVVIANGENAKQGVDALAANYLAAAADAPILLTQANTLPKETKDALTSLFKASGQDITVYVMGKTDSVSQKVRDEIVSTIKDTISSLGSVKVQEIAGNDRYETSAKAAVEGEDLDGIHQYDLGEGSLRTAFLASGQVNADALAAGGISAAANVPVLLTSNGDTLPASVSSAISSLHIGQVVILGSTDRVSQKIEDALKEAGVNVLRLAGIGTYGRYDTAVKIATLGRNLPTDTPKGFGTSQDGLVYLANGNGGFADALAVGPLAASAATAGMAHVVLTVSDSDVLPPSVTVFIKTATPAVTSVQAVGGTDRITDAAITAAQAAIK